MASLEVVKSTAFFGPDQIINHTKSIRINILIGLTLINMVINTNKISYSTLVVNSGFCDITKTVIERHSYRKF